MGCLPRIKSPKVAVILLTFYAFTSGCLSTYLVSMISTLEKRFEWPTSRVGWLLAADDLGYLTTVLLVAYYGGKGRQSLVLSLSAFFLFVSACMRALPYLLFGPKFGVDQIRGLFGGAVNASIGSANSTETLIEVLVPNLAHQQAVSFAIQFAGGVVQGVAATPFWNVGMALVDDMAGRNSGIFMGFLFLVRTMSPIVGFLFGSFLITVNEGLVLRPEEFPQGLKDPMWVGAWWLGIVVAGCIVLVNTPLLAMLDVKGLRKAGEDDRAKGRDEAPPPVAAAGMAAAPTTSGNVDAIGSMTSIAGRGLDMSNVSCFELLQFIKELYSNTVFLTLYLGTIFEFGAFIILIGYFPKFIESHFYVNANTANIMSSVSLAGASALAIMISSLVSKVFPMSVTHMSLYHAVVNTISATAFPVLFLFRCDKVDMVGPHNFEQDGQLAEMTCYDPASCPKYAYNPVCVGGRSFMTPCLAGCTKLPDLNDTTPGYANCLCSNQTGSPGICAPQCSNVYAYLVLFFCIRVVGTIAAVQFTLIMMKIPSSREMKPLAMGSISFLFGLLGVITPPVAGKLIDTVCIVENPSSSGRSFCLFYDTDRFRQLVHGIGGCFQVPSCLLFFLSYWLSRSRYPVEKDEVTRQKLRRAQKAAEAGGGTGEELQRLPTSG
ncbi:hypothetical protein BOX15_Mlig031659g1 [Macrostomum lignano]|uniref:Solute carrier organic anion transporter family member n=2 Tax=Macrostomum lignano TaxID=282301 RepID=A0A267ETX9_9PLAT|nr:hypothetical protein BOX15_Mlig031659g1 [Macrostomum lignano]